MGFSEATTKVAHLINCTFLLMTLLPNLHHTSIAVATDACNSTLHCHCRMEGLHLASQQKEMLLLETGRGGTPHLRNWLSQISSQSVLR